MLLSIYMYGLQVYLVGGSEEQIHQDENKNYYVTYIGSTER